MDLWRWQTRIGDFWTLTLSQVYRELAAMAERGLVEAGQRGRRDRRPYELTAAGREVFQGWLGRIPTEETIRFPLLLAISFGRHMSPVALAAITPIHYDDVPNVRLTRDILRDPAAYLRYL